MEEEREHYEDVGQNALRPLKRYTSDDITPEEWLRLMKRFIPVPAPPSPPPAFGPAPPRPSTTFVPRDLTPAERLRARLRARKEEEGKR